MRQEGMVREGCPFPSLYKHSFPPRKRDENNFMLTIPYLLPDPLSRKNPFTQCIYYRNINRQALARFLRDTFLKISSHTLIEITKTGMVSVIYLTSLNSSGEIK